MSNGQELRVFDRSAVEIPHGRSDRSSVSSVGMRSLLASISIVAVTFLPACGSSPSTVPAPETSPSPSAWHAPSDLEPELHVQVGFPEFLAEPLAQKFEERTGVRVQLEQGDSDTFLAQHLARDYDNRPDLMFLSNWNELVETSTTAGFEMYEFKKEQHLVTRWQDRYKEVNAPAGALVGIVTSPNAPNYLSDWHDLTRPELKDRVVMADPRLSATSARLFATFQAVWGEDETFAYFDRLMANGMEIKGSDEEAIYEVAQGRRDVVLGGLLPLGRRAGLNATQPPKTNITPLPLVEPMVNPHPKAAKAFFNFAFSPEGQQVLADSGLLAANLDIRSDNAEAYADVRELDRDLSSYHSLKPIVDIFDSRYRR